MTTYAKICYCTRNGPMHSGSVIVFIQLQDKIRSTTYLTAYICSPSMRRTLVNPTRLRSRVFVLSASPYSALFTSGESTLPHLFCVQTLLLPSALGGLSLEHSMRIVATRIMKKVTRHNQYIRTQYHASTRKGTFLEICSENDCRRQLCLEYDRPSQAQQRHPAENSRIKGELLLLLPQSAGQVSYRHTIEWTGGTTTRQKKGRATMAIPAQCLIYACCTSRWHSTATPHQSI